MSQLVLQIINRECLNLLTYTKNINFGEVNFSKLSSKELVIITIGTLLVLSYLNVFLVLLLGSMNLLLGIFYPAFKLFHLINNSKTDIISIDRLIKYWIVYSLYSISSSLINIVLGNNIFFVAFNIIFLYFLASPNCCIDLPLLLYNKLVTTINNNKDKYDQFVNKVNYIENIIFYFNTNKTNPVNIEVIEETKKIENKN